MSRSDDPSVPARAGIGIRPAEPREYADIGRLTVDAYRDAGVLPGGDDYAHVLADAPDRAARAALFAAHDGAGALVGTVTTAHAGRPYADLAEPGELEFRMLAVAPAARGHGIGTALVDHCDRLARSAGLHALVLCVIDTNTAALALYDRLGFVRRPERDRVVSDGRVRLLVLTRAVRDGGSGVSPDGRSGPGPRPPG